jgi:hypothetical protein
MDFWDLSLTNRIHNHCCHDSATIALIIEAESKKYRKEYYNVRFLIILFTGDG